MSQKDHDCVPIRETQAWRMALDNLEQMNPRYLVELLENGQLESVLTQKVQAFAEVMTNLKEQMPGATTSEIREMAQADTLTPVNPDWQEEKPLTPGERKKLRVFRSQ